MKNHKSTRSVQFNYRRLTLLIFILITLLLLAGCEQPKPPDPRDKTILNLTGLIEKLALLQHSHSGYITRIIVLALLAIPTVFFCGRAGVKAVRKELQQQAVLQGRPPARLPSSNGEYVEVEYEDVDMKEDDPFQHIANDIEREEKWHLKNVERHGGERANAMREEFRRRRDDRDFA